MTRVLAAALFLFPMQDLPKPPGFPFDSETAQRYREEFSKASRLPVTLENSLGMKLALIPPGRFEMGNHGSKYRVAMARAYYAGVSEVTQAQLRAWRPDHKVDGAEEEFQAGDRPAAAVSRLDAQAFCAWLNDRPEEKAAKRTYALPTEAQWEWAARAGSAEDYPCADKKQLVEFAWHNHAGTPNPKHESGGRGRQPVMKLKPNAWGLYDLFGNVWEWCADRREDPTTGETRDPVMRGGSWRSGVFHCSTVARDPGDPRFKGDNIGFRVVCTVVP